MYIIPEDMQILCSDEVMDMQRQYHKKFGEIFLCFNYADFPGSMKHQSADNSRDALSKAVAVDMPHQIVSRRYDHSDH